VKVSLLWFALTLFALLLAPLTASAQTAGPVQPATTAAPATSEPAKVITVKVALGSGKPGEQLPADLNLTGATVTLYAMAGRNPAYSREAKPSAGGTAEFAAVPYQDGYGFGVVARVGLTAYVSELITPTPGSSEVTVPVMVFASTTDASKLRISQAYALAEVADEGKLQISILYILSNDGDTTVEGGVQDANGKAASLTFPLPTGAQDVQFEQDDGASYALTDRGFVARPGVRPGEASAQVGVRYTLPYSESLRLESALAYPVDKLTVFVANQGITLTSQSLISLAPQQRQDGTIMKAWGAEKLAPNQAVSYELTGKPVETPPPLPVTATNATSTSTGPLAAVIAFLAARSKAQVIGMGMIAIGALLTVALGGWWVYRSRFAPSPAEQQEQALVAALADLEEDHEAGRVEQVDYEQRRVRLKEALASLLAPSAQPESEVL
jgi:hypothetical protein